MKTIFGDTFSISSKFLFRECIQHFVNKFPPLQQLDRTASFRFKEIPFPDTKMAARGHHRYLGVHECFIFLLFFLGGGGCIITVIEWNRTYGIRIKRIEYIPRSSVGLDKCVCSSTFCFALLKSAD